MASNTKQSVPQATTADSLAVAACVAGPVFAKGVFIRRPGIMRLAERMDSVKSAVECLQRLKHKYGDGPLMVQVPGTKQALIFSTPDVRRILEETPVPFATATWEKVAALAHFQPQGVLISHGPERDKRRHFNEEVLGSDQPVHQLAENFVHVVESEVRASPVIRAGGELSWKVFENLWFPVVRRVILGDKARDDEDLREMINELRKAANWAFLHPGHEKVMMRLHERIRHYLANAEAGSLAEMIANYSPDPEVSPEDQISHWLFAFDPGGMTVFRALALLVTHPDQGRLAREELTERTGNERVFLPYLRRCVLDTLRLWPTTPLILRETTAETHWDNGVLPAGTTVTIFAPFFHRDEERLPEAHRFAPELWRADQPEGNWPLVPFSGGTAVCPARHLVLLVTSAMLGALFEAQDYRLTAPVRLLPTQALPRTLNHFTLRFQPE